MIKQTIRRPLAMLLAVAACACAALCWEAAAAWQQQPPPQEKERGLGLGTPTPKEQKKDAPRGPLETGRPELVVQTGHAKRADGIAFSPDGRLVATSGDDMLVKIWDAATARELRSLAHTAPARAVAFSPDGARLAAGAFDGQIKIWDAASGRELQSLKTSDQTSTRRRINALAFSPDGRWLVTGGNDGAVRLWDTTSGAEAQAIKGHAAEVLSIAFAADGRRVASGARDGAIKIWDASGGREVASLAGHTGAVASIAFSGDGKKLISGGADKTVKLWDVEKREARTLAGHTGEVLSVAFSSDGRQLFSAAADKRSVRVWDAATGGELSKSEDADAIERLVVASFSPDRRVIASSIGDKNVSLRGVARSDKPGHTLATRTGGVYSAAFSPDGKWFASGGKDNAVKLWETATGRQLSSNVDAQLGWTTALAFSPDSRLLVVGGLSGGIKVWEIESARSLPALEGHGGSVNALAFRADGLLASAGGDGAIKLWDAAGGRLVRALEGHAGGAFGVAFSPDGKRVASGGADKTVKVWDVAAGAAQTFAGHADVVRSVAFNADGTRVASASRDKSIKIWDAASGAEVKTIAGTDGFSFVAYDPAGKRLFAGTAAGRVAAYDATTFVEVYARASHTAEVNGAAFSRGGRWLVTAGEDGSLRLWEAESGELAATLVSMFETNDWLVAAPDGLFDGSPEAWDQILWRFAGRTTEVRPVEVYFNEFYYPGLLADILAGKRPKAEKDILLRDRRQPRVGLVASGAGAASAREAAVRIEIEEAAGGAGARDVRLFRNGLLVKAWRGDVLEGKGRRVIETTVPVRAGENRLTAYAFNRDNVKSADAELTLRGDESLRRRGTAYILAVGLNVYANKVLNLRFARKDAEAFGAQVQLAQAKVGAYTDIEVVPLYDTDATKQNILYALSRLSGSTAAPPPNAPPALERLKRAQPEDTVFVYYAGHGIAVNDSFYLIPHDPGYVGLSPASDAERERIRKSHFVSDRELESSLEGVDAAQIVLVLDACNSGQVLDSEESRRGPMNTRGLAQLAYEKGMFILTASQSFQSALELAELGHGLLTHALVVQGLEQGAADSRPHDGQIVMGEWLDYATERVPRMHVEKIRTLRGQSRGISGNSPPATGTRQAAAPDERSLQRPRVFYRRELAFRPLVVTKFGEAATRPSTQ